MLLWCKDLWLFTIDEYNQLPDGIILEGVFGTLKIKGEDSIDMDTRENHIAYGIRSPMTHKESELFTKFKLIK